MTRMIARWTRDSSSTSFSAITMISADRMKSVRMAPETVLASTSGPSITAGSSSSCSAVVVTEPVVDLLGALETEVRTADHQDDLDEHRRDGAEDQCGGEDEQDLVAQRAGGDLADDRQFAIGGEPAYVGGCDRGVVDDDAGGLDTRPPRGGAHVVDRRGRQLGERGDVIE